ncbi:MAG TPA: hypothetical protein DCW41_06610 [Clostridiales bacterium]|nr:hypothetical protein [Clostridiales bacterium]
MVHNLICGSFTSVGEGTDSIVDGKLRQRYTPYHIPHRTEVMGFVTILHGDNRFYNNIFLQKWPSDPYVVQSDSKEGEFWPENRETGTRVWDDYPTYDEWISMFDMDSDVPDMQKLAVGHFSPLPVWSEGNLYLGGAKPWKNEKGCIVDDGAKVDIDVEERDGKFVLKTDLYDYIKDASCDLIDSDTLGKAFEPEQRFEDPDGSTIVFDTDYNGNKRTGKVIPGPFAEGYYGC